ncbi:hypothetical protein C8034_v004423 [Colletotrichum sidae]|uniref:Uncharacterized protein n=1 Tax=Colletotrichum sidae TaxID=1347389 RepID=A0A4R8RWX2_9PEZI|nr:hypothetical protein C8034_v004423 [Colletotrichum sidae]
MSLPKNHPSLLARKEDDILRQSAPPSNGVVRGRHLSRLRHQFMPLDFPAFQPHGRFQIHTDRRLRLPRVLVLHFPPCPKILIPWTIVEAPLARSSLHALGARSSPVTMQLHLCL